MSKNIFKNYQELYMLKEEFFLALSENEIDEAKKIFEQIDEIYKKLSGVSFKQSLTNEELEKVKMLFYKENQNVDLIQTDDEIAK